MTIYPQPIAIELTPRFQRDLRTLAKRYRNIRNDIQPVIEQLQAGELPGSRIPGMEYEIFKVRIKNSDIQKGKSAGYRAIYYLKTSDSIVLVTIYSKSDLSDIAAETVREILAQYEQQLPESEE
ncbi:MAG: type II toxin-antitoxin system RelE/ParE family toxin [Oscillatoriales cyanobacterium]|nr:MAG: type II toxin-antitoxin system RelE/ParE family toxin [Oscillatoriales cyanobacterium]